MKRKHVSVACVACRRSRAKCSGQIPCESCVRHDIECKFDQIRDDGRSKEARKRKLAEFEHDSELLNELIETVKASNDEGIAQIMTLIRSNAPMDDIKASVKEHIALTRQSRRERLPELEHFIAQVEDDKRPGRKALDITLLVEPPPISVSATPWTDVTDDDFLVSDLVSSWMTWDQYFYNWLDEDLFLRDMQSENLSATYCSPFLVNAMLALACTYSDYAEAKTQKGKLSQLADNFLVEAQRLFKIDSSASLTNIQGLGYLYVAVCVNGQDGLGYQLIQQAVSMCEKLMEQHREADALLTAVEQKTCGGIFNLYAISMLAWQRPMQFSPPNVSSKQPVSRENDWVPYPLSGDSATSHSNELFERYSSLIAIAYEISLMWSQVLPAPLEKNEDMRLEKRVSALYHRLFEWYIELPDHLRPRAGCPPSLITHLAFYWKLVQTLSTIVLQTLDNPSLEAQEQARTWNLKAALEIETLCRYHQTSFGSSHMSLNMINPVLHSLFTLTEAADVSVYSTAITNLCVFCRAMARRWPFCMAAFRMYQVQMQEKGIKLPVETDKLFEDFENSQWSNVELEKLKTIYPVPSDAGADKRNMGDFLRAMDKLNIEHE